MGLTAGDPLTLGRAWDLFDRLVEAIRRAAPEIAALHAADGLRRNEPVVRAIAIVGSTPDPASALAALAPVLSSHHIEHYTASSIAFVFRGARVELHLSTPETLGSTLLHATGSAAHLAQLSARGLTTRPFASEAELYASLDLPLDSSRDPNRRPRDRSRRRRHPARAHRGLRHPR